jgi:poly(3-hydroxybutyrate) depolymerase
VSGTGGSGTGGTSSSGGQSGSGGRSGSGGASATGGSTSTGGQPGTGGESATGGRSGSGGATSQPGTGGAAGGNPGRDGGAATGGAGGGTASDGGGSTPAGQSAGCGKTSTITSSQYNNGTTISITAASMQRRYILNVPTNYDNTKPYKLVIAWHQLDGNDKQMYANKYYHLLDLSKDSTIFVAPNGQKSGAPCSGTGNGESGCGWPNTNGQDMALGDAVVAQIEQNFCVDTNRIFATGWSYGGSMSYENAAERPLGGTVGGVAGYLRAIAVYSGAVMSGNVAPSLPVAYYASHGTQDTVLCYDSTSTGCSVGGIGGVGMFQNFATVNGCTWATPAKATGNHVCTSLTGCKTGYPAEFCSFVGGHTPDPTEGGAGSWEYQNVWTFFSQF